LLVALAALLLLTVQGASASKGWCMTDPVVAIDGQLADIFVAAPLDAPLLVTGPTQIVVAVPVGVDAWLVASDLGFGKGEEVSFTESRALRVTNEGIEVRVAVYVPATDGAMPVKVDFAPNVIGLLQPASAQGTANEWVRLTTVL
jgi:hypothetical protein